MSNKYVSMLTDLEYGEGDGTVRLSTWESDFIASITQQIQAGGELTQKQKEKLTGIYEEKVLGW